MIQSRYAKAIVAVLGAVVTSALTIWGPDTNVGRFLVIASAGLTAASVYVVRNAPEGSGGSDRYR
jgi:hypothetical protein